MGKYDFMKKFKIDEYCLKEFKYWVVCLREKQVTLGSCVILLKREVDSLGKITNEEMCEFIEVCKWYEDVCKNKFGAVKFNYLIRMMKDNFVHYHAFPRYLCEFEMFGERFSDKEMKLNFDDYKVIDKDRLNLIKACMINN